jgi:hypothetical protein
MTVIKGTGFYHVEAANTNRQVSFAFQAIAAAAGVAAFGLLKGTNAFPPWSAALSAPTINQLIAQYRVDYLVRYVSIYAIPVGVYVTEGTANTPTPNDTVVITYETYQSFVFPTAADIVDLRGLADRSAKTKSGLSTLATACIANATLDGVAGDLWVVNAPNSLGTASTAPAVTSIAVTALTTPYVPTPTS